MMTRLGSGNARNPNESRQVALQLRRQYTWGSADILAKLWTLVK